MAMIGMIREVLKKIMKKLNLNIYRVSQKSNPLRNIALNFVKP